MVRFAGRCCAVMVRFAGRCCAVMREVGVRCEPHVPAAVRKCRGEPVDGRTLRVLENPFCTERVLFFCFSGDHCTGSCTVIYVSIVLNTCRSEGRASNRSTDRQIRVVPEQIADQQIVVPRAGGILQAILIAPFFVWGFSSSQGIYYTSQTLERFSTFE